MKRQIRTVILVAAGACALILSGCGSDAVATTNVVPESAASAEASEPSPEATVAINDEADGTASEDEVVDSAAVVPVDVRGAATSVRPGCNLGLPFNAGEGNCESFGGYLIQPVTFRADLRGTLDGSYTQHGTFAVAPDGSYVFASIDTFVGTVAECGEGTVVWNSAGWGNFEVTEPAQIFAISRNTSWISYTAAESELSTLDVALSATTMQTALTSVEMTGTVSCGGAGSMDELVAAARPDSSVDADNALEWTGPSTLTIGPTCTVTPDPDAPGACPKIDGFSVQPLRNELVFSGSLEGEVRFFADNLVTTRANYEHSGIVIFEGAVEGCGEGVVVFVNEAVGNANQFGFDHLRGYTPQGFDPGPLGVHIDGTATLRGPLSTESDGSYSC
jgi:hypothetical protein